MVTFTQVYSVAELVAELQRVAELVGPGTLTQTQLDTHSSISNRTVVRRFGSWRNALHAAGLHNGDTDQTATDTTRSRRRSRSLTDQQVLAELRRVADLVQPRPVTLNDLHRLSPIGYQIVRSRFGSWRAALHQAGLPVSRPGAFFTDDELAANLSRLLHHYQRLPTVSELNRPPSTATYWTYRNRYGSLTNAQDQLLTSGPS